jgi:hypothetical protein
LALTAADGKPALAHALKIEAFEARKGETRLVEFEFDEKGASRVEAFLVDRVDDKPVELSGSMAVHPITFSQLSEKKTDEGPEVVLYAVFDKAFKKGLSLRAYDWSGAEVGRSEEAPALDQSADSATYLTFKFDPRVPMHRVARYKVFEAPGKKPSASASSTESSTSSNPSPIRSKRVLVPKNP